MNRATWDSNLGFYQITGGPSWVRFIPDGGDATATTGQVIVSFNPNWTPPAPELNGVLVQYGENPTVDMINLQNLTVQGSQSGSKYIYDVTGVTLPEAFQNQDYFTDIIISGSNYSGTGTANWVSGDFRWEIENGPIEINFLPDSTQTDVNGSITIIYDPNWQPPTSTVDQVSLVDVSSGNLLYNASNLGITDVGGVWTINGAQLSSALSSGQELDVSISGNNVPSVSGSRVTLAIISDTPNLTATASPWTMTFYPQGSNVYNISLTVGGQN